MYDIFLFAIVFIVILISVLILSKRKDQSQPTSNEPDGYLGMRCLDKCVDRGVICEKKGDQRYGICKSLEGVNCDSLYDCVQGLSCSSVGFCSRGNGGLNSKPPCLDGYSLSSLGVCKISTGGPCYSKDECLTGKCSTSGVCFEGKTLGSKCSGGDECLSDFCGSLGYCEVSGTVSGGVGSYCTGSRCDAGLFCSYIKTSDGSISSTCSPPGVGCEAPLISYLGLCIYPLSSDRVSCDPLTSTTACQNGASCSPANLCIYNSGYPYDTLASNTKLKMMWYKLEQRDPSKSLILTPLREQAPGYYSESSAYKGDVINYSKVNGSDIQFTFSQSDIPMSDVNLRSQSYSRRVDGMSILSVVFVRGVYVWITFRDVKSSIITLPTLSQLTTAPLIDVDRVLDVTSDLGRVSLLTSIIGNPNEYRSLKGVWNDSFFLPDLNVSLTLLRSISKPYVYSDDLYLYLTTQGIFSSTDTSKPFLTDPRGISSFISTSNSFPPRFLYYVTLDGVVKSVNGSRVTQLPLTLTGAYQMIASYEDQYSPSPLILTQSLLSLIF
jgi:hypothetical protein